MKEVFEYIISLLKSRIFPMILVFIVLISVLVHRLFVLQIICLLYTSDAADE